MNEEIRLSVVIPCLNESRTIGNVVKEALLGLVALDLPGEVIVADNGSTDGSAEIAIREGARVVKVPIRGYGAALHHGIISARGQWVIYGDADMSYDFGLIPRFKDYIVGANGHGGRDLILGSRIRGRIEPGAMPFLNRHLGTPVLNLLIRLFFGLRTSDCNSGMRLVRREFYAGLPMRAPGMEWASELLIKSKMLKGAYAEVPIVLRRDQRGSAPHLRRWRDGWRHLKTIVLLSPNRLIVAPSLLALLAAAVLMARGRPDLSLLLGIVAETGLILGLMVKLILHIDQARESTLIGGLLERPFAEALLLLGLLTAALGAIGLSAAGGTITALTLFFIFFCSSGTLLILASFFWGTILTHCIKKLY